MNLIQYYYYLCFALFIFYCKKGYTLVISIKNDDDNFYNLNNVINNNQNGEDLTIKFGDDYYDMTQLTSHKLEFTIEKNITFIGNKKRRTVLDYKRDIRGCIQFRFNNNKGNTVTVENIVVKNYNPEGQKNTQAFMIFSEHDNFQVIFNNCIFQNNDYELFTLNVYCIKQTQDEPQLLFNNCQFYNNSESLISTRHRYIYVDEDLYKSLMIKMSNCILIENNSLFIAHYTGFIFENCYFSSIESNANQDYKFSLFYSISPKQYLRFFNSTFEDINIKSTLPLIESSRLTLEIENSIFKNCTTNYGYLIKAVRNILDDSITIKNSTFTNICTLFQADSTSYKIIGSTFHDIHTKNNIPSISDSKYSNYIINDTIFNKLIITNGLFNKESHYNFNNVTLQNIETNSEAVLNFLYNDIIIENMYVNDISCVGDSGDTSFIFYDSGDINKKLVIKNMQVKNSKSNGPFIKIIGKVNELLLENSNITNIKSYGSIIEIQSNETTININDLNFSNNFNNNKFDCGSIHLSNDLNLSINNSNFINNTCKNNGGAICLDNIENMNLYLTSNTFINNKAISGGALYFSNSIDHDEENTDNEIIMNHNVFNKNHADNFGGAVYSKYNQLYLTNANNNTITYNSAGVMGGGIFSPNSINKNMFNLNQWTFVNNTVNAYENNYSTHPAYINLETKIDNNTIDITTGNYFPLYFTLYDEYNNAVDDKTKYYSSLTIKLSLIEKYDEEEDMIDDDIEDPNELYYYVVGNIGTFINGRCELNKFRIYANPGIYFLKITFDNYNGIIKTNFDTIKINVTGCNENQIKRYNNKILYCENPICHQDCPVSVSAICKPNSSTNNNLINDINNNKCVCLVGWDGENCKNKIILNFSKQKKLIRMSIPPTILLICCYIVFIIHNKKQGIINDTGFTRQILFSSGIMLYFLSNIFIFYENYTQCSIYFIFKNIGISLVITIFVINICFAHELGITKNRLTRYNNNRDDHDDNDYYNNNEEAEIENGELIDNENENNENTKTYTIENANIDKINIEKIKKQNILYLSFENHFNIDDKNQISSNFIKKIKTIHSIFLEIIILYMITILSFFFLVLYYKIQYDTTFANNIIQGTNGYWFYQCRLEKPDLIFNLFYFILVIFMIIMEILLKKHKFIFRYNKYIKYSAFVLISFGPTINILSYIFLYPQRKAKIYFDFTTNSLSYLSVFILFSWDKIYYIIKKEGNDSYNYFIYERHEKCLIHHSTICGCKLNTSKSNIKSNNEKYIAVYRICSKICLNTKDLQFY